MEDDLPSVFAQVVGCSRCTQAHSSKLLRDSSENVPQPGYVGRNYANTRLLLAGQNPGVCPPRFAERDAEYTRALRAVRDQPDAPTFEHLREVLERFVPSWPIHGSYFPLAECGLRLDEIAYCNVVRCRTLENAPPSSRLASECVSAHFGPWLDLLAPIAVVFLGMWAFRNGVAATAQRGISSSCVNRDRSLTSEQRALNRTEVVAFVQRHLAAA